MKKFGDETVVDSIKSFIYKCLYKFNYILTDYSGIDLKNVEINIDKNKNKISGDYSTNVLLHLLLSEKDIILISNSIIKEGKKTNLFSNITFAKPGFLNFFLSDDYYCKLLNAILNQREKYGSFKKKNLFYDIEFVSASIAHHLDIPHARRAVYGDTLVRI
jgi:arginyl-tRNA synthetase